MKSIKHIQDDNHQAPPEGSGGFSYSDWIRQAFGLKALVVTEGDKPACT